MASPVRAWPSGSGLCTEPGFLARDQLFNIAAVPPDQEKRHHADGQGCYTERRPERGVKKRHEHGCDQRGKRGIAKKVGGEHPDRKGSQTKPNVNGDQDTEGSGHAFAALKPKKQREEMAEEDGDDDQGNATLGHAVALGEFLGKKDREPALCRET